MSTERNPVPRLNSTAPWRTLVATLAVALAGLGSQLASAQPAPPPHGGMGMMEMGMPGGLMGPIGAHALDLVNATPEQRAQIRQIVAAAHADLKGQREAGRALHERARTLFVQPTIDTQAAEQLRQQMLAQHDVASKRMLQAALDVARVLTPEQRRTLSDRMGQWHTMMERHRAERATLGGGASRPAR